MFTWFDKISHTGQKFLHRMSVRTQMAGEEGRHRMEEAAEHLESSSGLGRISQGSQRLWHRVSVRTQLWGEESRHRVLETVEEGREVVQSAAASVLTTLATPVAWTDDVLGHRIGVLGWTRDHLNQLVQELEPTPEAATAATPSADLVEQTEMARGERRKYDRRQYAREGSGRRDSDRLMKERLEEVVPRQVAPGTQGPGSVSPMAAVNEALPVSDLFSTSTGNVRVVMTAEHAGAMPGQETMSATIAEMIEAHPGRQLAIPDYDELNVHRILAAVRKLPPKDVPNLLAHEKSTKNRKSITDVMEKVIARTDKG